MEKRKLKRKSNWWKVAATAALVSALVTFTFGKGVLKIWRLTLIQREEQAVLDTACSEKETFEHEIERLKTDSTYIEEIARREYGMIKEGEEVFHITLPDTTRQKNND